ncbi:MAG: FliM/FliN family flagellar motor switch protein [Tatlockia sp.]|nr:FliM/FliN family flagellar motor switch protein [Tatlockia sp.]
MNITVKRISLPEQSPQTGSQPLLNENYLNIVGAVEVECQIRLGTVVMTIAELRELKQGQTLRLNQKIVEPIDILLNNQIIARGELRCADDFFAIQITEIAS